LIVYNALYIKYNAIYMFVSNVSDGNSLCKSSTKTSFLHKRQRLSSNARQMIIAAFIYYAAETDDDDCHRRYRWFIDLFKTRQLSKIIVRSTDNIVVSDDVSGTIRYIQKKQSTSVGRCVIIEYLAPIDTNNRRVSVSCIAVIRVGDRKWCLMLTCKW